MGQHHEPPLIVVGMHRSGTTFITRILHDIGVYMGYERTYNEESCFFQTRNRLILRSLCANWCFPDPVTRLSEPELLNRYRVLLERDCSSCLHTFSYLGPKLLLKYFRLTDMDVPWGWKDPRNSLLLPLWTSVFPNAKIIHIYRNGVDVANSLALREKENLLHTQKADIIEAFKRSRGSLLLVLLKGLRRFAAVKSPYYRYCTLESAHVADFKAGFTLWEKYLTIINDSLSMCRTPVISVCYEDFLLNPAATLAQIVDFLDIDVVPQKINEWAGRVRQDRAYAFLRNGGLDRVYEAIDGSHWFHYYRYDERIRSFLGGCAMPAGGRQRVQVEQPFRAEAVSKRQ